MLENKLKRILPLGLGLIVSFAGCEGQQTVSCYTNDSSKDHCYAYYHGEAHESLCDGYYNECKCKKPKGASDSECECHCERTDEPYDKGY